MSIAFTYVPVIKNISAGFAIVICTVVTSLIGALVFPVEQEEE